MTSSSRPSIVEARLASHEIVAAVDRLRRAIRSVASDDALSGAQASVLALLAKNGAATPTALAAAEGVRPQSMTGTLAALDKKGLIERHADPNDGRRHIVMLSAAGEAAFQVAQPARQAWLADRIQAKLSSDQTQLLLDAATLLQTLVGG